MRRAYRLLSVVGICAAFTATIGAPAFASIVPLSLDRTLQTSLPLIGNTSLSLQATPPPVTQAPMPVVNATTSAHATLATPATPQQTPPVASRSRAARTTQVPQTLSQASAAASLQVTPTYMTQAVALMPVSTSTVGSVNTGDAPAANNSILYLAAGGFVAGLTSIYYGIRRQTILAR